MAKRIKQRKDDKGRVLNKGETQRKSDGMYIYTCTGPYGSRRYVYSKDLLTLREKEKELLRDQIDGLDIYLAGKATLDFVFDRYISTKYNLRSSTRSNYKYTYDQYVRGGFGARLIKDIKYSDVKSFYTYLLNEKNLQINSVDNVHTILHPTFAMAVRDEIIRKNPSDSVLAEIKKNSGKNKGIRHALTPEQQRAFIRFIEQSPEYNHWYPLFVVMFGTGCRIGEVIGLRWQDVDFEKKRITIDHAATYYPREERKSVFEISLPKTEASIRVIPMLAQVEEALTMEYERQKVEGFSDFQLDGMTGFIFTNRNGSLHVPHTINQAINRISEAYNAIEIIKAKRERREPVIIPHFSCHVTRHSFCSRLCENDVNVKVIQDVMGHKQIETTLDVYAEVNYSKKKDEFDNLSGKVELF